MRKLKAKAFANRVVKGKNYYNKNGEKYIRHDETSSDVVLHNDTTVENILNTVSSPNLVINPDFRVNQYFSDNLINGRDFPETNNFDPICDCWTSASWTRPTRVQVFDNLINDRFLRVTCKKDTPALLIRQFVELDTVLKQRIQESKMTFSMKIRASKRCAYHYTTNDIVELNTNWKVITCDYNYNEYLTTNKTALSVFVGIKDINVLSNPDNPPMIRVGDYFDVAWVKLELGEATPFVPRHVSEELLACKRYFQIITVNNTIWSDMYNNEFKDMVNLPITLRHAPIVSYSVFDNYNITSQKATSSNSGDPVVDCNNIYVMYVLSSSAGIGHRTGMRIEVKAELGRVGVL